MTTRRVLLALALLLPACGGGGARPSLTTSTTAAGVEAGTPVIARFNPDNAVVTSVQAGAAQVGLGAVQATGFQPDCSPAQGFVVVCRNPAYTNGQATATKGPDSCVVQLDPRLGGGPRADRITRALRRCLS